MVTRKRPTDKTAAHAARTNEDAERAIVEKVGEIAEGHGVPRAQIALAWVRQKPEITAPIVGATRMRHLDDAVASLDIELTAEEIEVLEAPYRPQPIAGFK